MTLYSDIKFDCKHFKGAIPCKPNKLRNKVCGNCDEYLKIDKKILIIKLGAIGDVIRSTPLLTKYKSIYPNCHITWITQSPDVLPKSMIDEIYKMDALNVYKVENTIFDIAINLDKEIEACSMLANVSAKEKYGYIWKDGHLAAATPAAEHKIVTGLYDNISKENQKNYLEEIFEICHFKFNKEQYLLNFDETLAKKWNEKIASLNKENKKIIGLNTGCGARWQTRLWPQEYWIDLIKKLQNQGYFPVVLGGPDEDEVNKFYAKETGCFYPGHYSLQEFISLTENTHLIVTQVSMMMHIALGLKKPLVLFNNIFNRYEFELYGNGVIAEPHSGCDCYFGNTCSRTKSCMYDLPVDDVLNHINKLLSK